MPAVPTFRSGVANSLWWGATYDATDHRCSSQGKTVVQDLQDGIIRKLRDNATIPIATDSADSESINGISVRASSIHADGQFDGYTLLGLYVMCADENTPAVVRDSIIADWNRMNVNPQDETWTPMANPPSFSNVTTAAIIWKSQFPDLAFQWVHVDPATIPPLYNQPAVPDGDVNGYVACGNAPGLDSDAAVSIVTPDLSTLTPTPGNQAARGVTAVQPQAGGYPLIAPGNSTAATNMTTASTVGLAAAAVGAAGLAVGIAVAIARSMRRHTRRRR